MTVLDQRNAANLERIARALERIAKVMEIAAQDVVKAEEIKAEREREERW